jgi:hypothetical protein
MPEVILILLGAFLAYLRQIRQTLETEFRAALGSWRAWLAILLEDLSVFRQNRP